MCMHLNLKTARVQWGSMMPACIWMPKYCGTVWTLALRKNWGSWVSGGHGPFLWDQKEVVRLWDNVPVCCSSWYGNKEKQCWNLPGSASTVLTVFYWGWQTQKSYQVFQGTTWEQTENQSFLSCFTICFAMAAVPNLVPNSQFAWGCLLLFSGSRLCRVSSKLSSKGWGTLFNVSNVIFNGVMNCFPFYNFVWINLCNEVGGFNFFWNGCLSTPPNSSPRSESGFWPDSAVTETYI